MNKKQHILYINDNDNTIHVYTSKAIKKVRWGFFYDKERLFLLYGNDNLNLEYIINIDKCTTSDYMIRYLGTPENKIPTIFKDDTVYVISGNSRKKDEVFKTHRSLLHWIKDGGYNNDEYSIKL